MNKSGLGAAGLGGARRGLAGRAGAAWLGRAWPGWAGLGGHGEAWRGAACLGWAWRAGLGVAWLGGARLGWARLGRLGLAGWAWQAGLGSAGHGKARLGGLGRRGGAWPGAAWPGLAGAAWRGMAGQGKAWQGFLLIHGVGASPIPNAPVPMAAVKSQRHVAAQHSDDHSTRKDQQMKIRVELTGKSPLLMHNPQMVDPDNPINREIKMITGKRKKTDEDMAQIGKLEWYGGLYTDGVNGKQIVVQPTSKVRKCLINTAKISKLGKNMERALLFTDLNVPLIYDGPRSIDELFADNRYHSRLSVGVNNKRVMRVRPKFLPWGLVLDGIFIEDAGMNFDEFERIVELAGQVEGMGDNRVNGYGRFEGKVVKL